MWSSIEKSGPMEEILNDTSSAQELEVIGENNILHFFPSQFALKKKENSDSSI
jgi:hypothetical protein